MTVDVVVDRLVDAVLVRRVLLVFSSGFDVPRAHEENADLIPDIHLGFLPQVLKSDSHSVVVSGYSPPLFPWSSCRARIDRLAALGERRRGALPVKVYRPRGTMDATLAPRCTHRGSTGSP